MLVTIAASLLLTASSVPVEVGKFDPKQFPNLVKLDRRMPHGEMTRRVEQIMKDGERRIEGQSAQRFDITVPYAVLMESSGRARKVVVSDIGCQPIEVLVGQVVVGQAARGDFPVKQDRDEQWYVSDLNFALGEPTTALVRGEEDKMVCTQSRPKLGSRIQTVKQCMTAAQWKVFEADRQQMRRHLNNSVCRPGSGKCDGE